MRDARAEAYERLAGRYEARVLEPSPPAVADPPWFADDPVARGQSHGGREVVSPVGTGDLRWDDLARENPSLGAWCAERWLGAWRRLEPAPSTLAVTRVALHRVAEHVLKPARERADGKIGLRYTLHGFGTPFFGQDRQVRVEGVDLVDDSPAGERRAPLSTLGAAAAHVDVPLTVEDGPLEIDPAAAAFLAAWYGFATSALEELRAEAEPELDPSRVQLWPEHFDVSVELGAEAAGRRANFGASPGDDEHPEPYVYVGPWDASAASGEGWNATAFPGAELAYAELLGAPDQRAAALEFLRDRLRALS
ncbi:MAG: hypothetical protein M3155_10245 [Actinomycetota bacterium]|nr:hypothetical protein [Actinomycetota bacterium]